MITDILGAAISELDTIRVNLRSERAALVRSFEKRSLIKATSLTWFNNHRPKLVNLIQETDLDSIDSIYKSILSRSDKAGTRAKYLKEVKILRDEIIALRSRKIAQPQITRNDDPPDFSPLISDQGMRCILQRRWIECAQCIRASSPLAATVMMGGLLEALLLARIQRESDKTLIMNSKSAPKDKSHKTLPLQEWTLRHFIDVLHEVKFISHSAKDVGTVLRDYRNYIHPYKELSHGISLELSDAELWWGITKGITKDLLNRI